MQNNRDINTFNKKHDYLICIDSDGTVIDAMNAKHKHCHGPAFIEAWGLQDHEKEIQDIWNEINLYNETRGVNRFIALVEMLERLNGKYIDEPNIALLRQWVQSTPNLSNKGLQEEIEKTNNPFLKKVFAWSKDINRRIDLLSYHDKPPFDKVKSFFEFAHGKVDIAVVSSSNMSAITEEWAGHDLIKYVDVMTSQEIGTKGECIAMMIKKGYDSKRVLMIGDAYPDLDAAIENHTYYYPILTNKEPLSWKLLLTKYYHLFVNDQYGEVQQEILDAFTHNFSDKGEKQ